MIMRGATQPPTNENPGRGRRALKKPQSPHNHAVTTAQNPTRTPPAASTSLLANVSSQLRQFAPFARMQPQAVQAFVAAASEVYFAPGERILSPADGPARQLYFVRQGAVVSHQRSGGDAVNAFQFDGGDMFPIDAVLVERTVSATYSALVDTFCLRIDANEVVALAAQSPEFADFLNRRALQLMDWSRHAMQVAHASQTLAEQSLESPLSSLPRKPTVSCTPQTSVREALERMHVRRVGSIVVLGPDDQALGILTQVDILARITLPQYDLSGPIANVMTSPVHTLSEQHSIQDAALLMARHGLRHVPLTAEGRVVGIVSERDLFAVQRRSLNQVGGRIRMANDTAALRHAAHDIRQLARQLIAQGVGAQALTELISHLNDLLTQRMVRQVAERHGCDMRRACWLAFGSEGRSEQTIATDQDNGLVFESDEPESDRPRWLAFAAEVNQTLDDCGYPLCRGQVMASNPACCLTSTEWCDRFESWMAHGAADDLMNASIYFDFRALAGQESLMQPLREWVQRRAPQGPRFLRQMAENALRNPAPLNWRGALDTVHDHAHEWLDLKLHGTMPIVDAARIYALAHGIAQTNTHLRLEAIAHALGVSTRERDGWIHAFEHLQWMRLQVQVARPTNETTTPGHANRVDVATLSDMERRILKEAVHAVRRLQQRLQLDYLR